MAADVICDCLKKSGVEVIFGIPGVYDVALYEALSRSSIRVVSVKHEQAAGFMANGYGRSTGKTGVLLTIPGPGFTNAITGIAEAFADSIPLVWISTKVRNDEDWSFKMHEIPQDKIAAPITKSVLTIENTLEIEDKIHSAFRIANSDEPGPVLLGIPFNILSQRAERHFRSKKSIGSDIGGDEKPEDMRKIVEIIQKHKKIGLLAGQGTLDESKKLRQFAEWLDAPIMTTLSARGCFPEDHDLSLGFCWTSTGIDSLNAVFNRCDLIIALGVKFSAVGTHGYGLNFSAPLLHIDSCADVLGKNYSTSHSFQFYPGEFLSRVLKEKEKIGQRKNNALRELINEQRAIQSNHQKHLEHKTGSFKFGGREHSPALFFKALREVLPDDAIMVTDSGQHQVLVRENYPVLSTRSMLLPTDFQAMGYAIPAAIGAAIGNPSRKVAAVVGDGCFLMSGFEILTAIQESINLVIIILNDSSYGFIEKAQEKAFGSSLGTKLIVPDFERLADSFGVHYQHYQESVQKTLQTAFERKGITFVEIKVQMNGRSRMQNMIQRGRRSVRRLVPKHS